MKFYGERGSSVWSVKLKTVATPPNINPTNARHDQKVEPLVQKHSQSPQTQPNQSTKIRPVASHFSLAISGIFTILMGKSPEIPASRDSGACDPFKLMHELSTYLAGHGGYLSMRLRQVSTCVFHVILTNNILPPHLTCTWLSCFRWYNTSEDGLQVLKLVT